MIFGWVESIKCGAHERLTHHNITHHNKTTTNNHQPPNQGGKRYTEANTIDLTFAGLALPDACERLKPHCRYIALKLPLNFNLDGLLQRVTSSLVRADDRCARKQLLVVLDTSGREHSKQHQRGEGEGGRGRGRGRGHRGGGGGGGGRGYKRDRDVSWLGVVALWGVWG